jgi:hypothetical protein
MTKNKDFKNIKLIVTDVDDTLVPESHMDLNPEYFDVIQKLQKKGVMFVAASGRQKRSLRKVFAPIKEDIAYLAENGTHIKTKDFEMSMKFEDSDYRKLAQELGELGGEFEFMPCQPDCAYSEENAEDFHKLFGRYGYYMEKVKNLIYVSFPCIIRTVFQMK